MVNISSKGWSMGMKLGAWAVVVGLVLSIAGCDKCGNLDVTGISKPKACSNATPK